MPVIFGYSARHFLILYTEYIDEYLRISEEFLNLSAEFLRHFLANPSTFVSASDPGFLLNLR